MLRCRSIAFALLVCCAQGLLGGGRWASGETVNDTGTWLALFASGDIESRRSDRWQWWFDGHARFFDDAGGFGQSIVRPGLGYRLGESATLWAGYGWIRTDSDAAPHFDEHRIWQQLTWSADLHGLPIGYRSRLEQRFVETGSDTGWRFRQLVAVREPLESAPRITLVAWDELFLNLNDTDWGADGGFDQNRAFLGLGYQHHPASPYRVEVGYLNQYVDPMNRDDVSNHLLSVNLFWNP